MKKSFYFLFTITIFISAISCKKDKTDPVISITGEWFGIMSLESYSYGFTMNLSQSGSDLQGDFLTDDKSVSSKLKNISEIKDKDVEIYFQYIANDTTTLEFKFSGTVNSSCNYISGWYYISGYQAGEWHAIKSSPKAALSQKQGNEMNLKEQLFKALIFNLPAYSIQPKRMQ